MTLKSAVPALDPTPPVPAQDLMGSPPTVPPRPAIGHAPSGSPDNDSTSGSPNNGSTKATVEAPLAFRRQGFYALGQGAHGKGL